MIQFTEKHMRLYASTGLIYNQTENNIQFDHLDIVILSSSICVVFAYE